MKILLDPQIFNLQKYGGISRYYTEIFTRLSTNGNIKLDLPIYYSENAYFLESNLYKKKYKTEHFLFKFLNKLGISTKSIFRKKNNKIAGSFFSNKEFDLFVPTYYNDYFLKEIGKKPYVLTVYDMIHEIFPEYFVNDQFLVAKNKLKLMQNSARIIAVSENTKKDILKIYPQISAEKIDVVYHGNSIVINESVDIYLPKNYILFVGSRPNYKNFYFLVESIKELLSSSSDLVLVCAGGGEFNKEEIDFIANLYLQNKIFQKHFHENELGMFYKKAKCFVFPSLYEGFGIPVLESMACGCPIILSNHSSFPEVAGNAGVYFEINNSKDLKNKIEIILNDKIIRKKYSDLGLEQVKKFDWNIAAEQCFEVYKKAVSN